MRPRTKKTGELKEINKYDFTKNNSWMTKIQKHKEWKKEKIIKNRQQTLRIDVQK